MHRDAMYTRKSQQVNTVFGNFCRKKHPIVLNNFIDFILYYLFIIKKFLGKIMQQTAAF